MGRGGELRLYRGIGFRIDLFFDEREDESEGGKIEVFHN